jgi:uncharacterized membrane protein YidH (DUF202 family)
MSSRAERPGPGGGLPTERTALAWERSALALGTLGAVFLGAAAHRDEPWALAPAAALALCGALAWRHGHAAHGPGRRALARDPRRPLALLVAATVVAALAAAVAVLL